MTTKPKNGEIVLEGTTYKAFEMFQNGPWKIVRGTKHGDPTVVSNIIGAKTPNQALKKWLENLNQ